MLYPVPDPIVDGVPRPDLQSAYANICNDVAIEPGSGDQRVLVNCAWRDGAAYNGFYYSQDGGQTFARVNPTGALNPQDVGRTTFAYADNGAMLYALVESMTHYTHSSQTALGGVFVSRTGSPAGPWNKVASAGQLASKGSALRNLVFYRPGIQAWYNQFIDVDPDDPEPRLCRSRGGLRDGGRRRALERNWSVLELRFPLLVLEPRARTAAR